MHETVLDFQEICEELLAVFGGNRLRVELYSVDGEFLVADAHNLALVCGGSDFEAVRGGGFA